MNSSTPPSLRTFSLKGKSLKCDTSESIKPHLEALEEDDQVEKVVMGGNTFGVGACHELACVLEKKSSLQEADLADIFTARLISEIPQALSSLCNSLLHLQSLTILDLSDNAFGGRCVDAMVPFLSSHLPLEELRLANNGLGPAGATVIANALYELGVKAKQAGKPSRLRKLVCGRNRCENGSTAAWQKVFEIHSELTEIRLYQNDIRNEGWAAIMAGINHCSKLEVLDMWDNTATEKGSKAVAATLPNLPALRELNLRDCLLRPRGGAMIARALLLGKNLGIELLNLSGSEIDEEVVGILVDFVEQHGSRLKKIELNDNYGDTEAAEELTGVWGSMKMALDGWNIGGEMDELDAIIERESDDEEAAESEEEGESEVEDEKSDVGVEADAVGEDVHQQSPNDPNVQIEQAEREVKLEPNREEQLKQEGHEEKLESGGEKQFEQEERGGQLEKDLDQVAKGQVELPENTEEQRQQQKQPKLGDTEGEEMALIDKLEVFEAEDIMASDEASTIGQDPPPRTTESIWTSPDPTKPPKSKEEALLDLMTQTIEALGLT